MHCYDSALRDSITVLLSMGVLPSPDQSTTVGSVPEPHTHLCLRASQLRIGAPGGGLEERPCFSTLFHQDECNLSSFFQGKSALWSHLIQFQDREEKQEHLAESPGKLVWSWFVDLSLRGLHTGFLVSASVSLSLELTFTRLTSHRTEQKSRIIYTDFYLKDKFVTIIF